MNEMSTYSPSVETLETLKKAAAAAAGADSGSCDLEGNVHVGKNAELCNFSHRENFVVYATSAFFSFVPAFCSSVCCLISSSTLSPKRFSVIGVFFEQIGWHFSLMSVTFVLNSYSGSISTLLLQ